MTDRLGPDGRPETFAQCMEVVADFLDQLDKAVETIAALTDRELPDGLNDRMIQQDLRAVAAHVAMDPALDAKLMSFMRGVQDPDHTVG